jgi:Fe-S cluster biogenesis protein NfuA/nitrite reductase/ring-hydroxylating ferredoxin subunit
VDFDEAVDELGALVEALEAEGDERALRALQLVDAVHRPALERIAAGGLDHPLAQALMAMYGLLAADEETVVEEALDEVRPYIHSHGGEVELLEVSDGVVHVRMSGACQGCAASAMTLRRGIEEVLRSNYPAFREVVAHEPEGPSEVPLLQIEDLRRPVFVEVGEAGAMAPGDVCRVDVEGVAVLLVRVEGELFAFRDGCRVDGLSLGGGRLSGAVLVCPWHNCAYDARTGRRVDQEDEPGLPVVPLALEDGTVKLAVNVA